LVETLLGSLNGVIIVADAVVAVTANRQSLTLPADRC
jgi:hypothetical protein